MIAMKGRRVFHRNDGTRRVMSITGSAPDVSPQIIKFCTKRQYRLLPLHNNLYFWPVQEMSLQSLIRMTEKSVVGKACSKLSCSLALIPDVLHLPLWSNAHCKANILHSGTDCPDFNFPFSKKSKGKCPQHAWYLNIELWHHKIGSGQNGFKPILIRIVFLESCVFNVILFHFAQRKWTKGGSCYKKEIDGPMRNLKIFCSIIQRWTKKDSRKNQRLLPRRSWQLSAAQIKWCSLFKKA